MLCNFAKYLPKRTKFTKSTSHFAQIRPQTQKKRESSTLQNRLCRHFHRSHRFRNYPQIHRFHRFRRFRFFPRRCYFQSLLNVKSQKSPRPKPCFHRHPFFPYRHRRKMRFLSNFTPFTKLNSAKA